MSLDPSSFGACCTGNSLLVCTKIGKRHSVKGQEPKFMVSCDLIGGNRRALDLQPYVV